jgi:ABC-type molybdate transport system substrate-binding protein
VKDSKNAALARSFLTFVASPAMQTILSDYGFGKP